MQRTPFSNMWSFGTTYRLPPAQLFLCSAFTALSCHASRSWLWILSCQTVCYMCLHLNYGLLWNLSFIVGKKIMFVLYFTWIKQKYSMYVLLEDTFYIFFSSFWRRRWIFHNCTIEIQWMSIWLGEGHQISSITCCWIFC